jgi:hypothetical protein
LYTRETYSIEQINTGLSEQEAFGDEVDHHISLAENKRHSSNESLSLALLGLKHT